MHQETVTPRQTLKTALRHGWLDRLPDFSEPDATIVGDEDLGKTILEIDVRGKRGIAYCKSMPGAVRPFERLRSRLPPARIYGVNTPPKTRVTSAALGE